MKVLAGDRHKLVLRFALEFVLCLMLTALNPWDCGLPVILVFAGIFMSVSNTSVNSLLQTFSSTKLRGVSVSMFMLCMRGGMSLGGLLTGISVSLLGVKQALFINGILVFVVIIFIGWQWLHSSSTVTT